MINNTGENNVVYDSFETVSIGLSLNELSYFSTNDIWYPIYFIANVQNIAYKNVIYKYWSCWLI